MTDERVPAPASPRVIKAGAAVAMAGAIAAVGGPMIAGFEGERTVAYLDPVKIITWCVGRTGPNVRVGQVFTHGQCAAFFDEDQRKVIVAIGRCTTVDVSLYSFAAFESFAFNAGSGTYCRKFAPLVNAGKLKAACAKLSLYVNAGGHPLPGLVNRRRRERAVCELGLK